MKRESNPTPLESNSRWAEDLKSLGGRGASPETIARVGEKIDAAISGPPSPGPGGTRLPGGAAGTVKIAAPLVAAAAIAIVWTMMGDNAPLPPSPPLTTVPAEPPTSPELGSAEVVPAAAQVDELRDADPSEQAEPPPESAQPVPSAAKRKAPAKRVPPPPAGSTSTLKEQLELFQRARGQAAKGDPAAALKTLDELKRRFSTSPLLPETQLLRVDILTRSGETERALKLADSLLEEPRLRGKRAELQRLRGELWQRRGDCGQALEAWRAALKLGLSGKSADEVRRAMSGCDGATP